METDISTTPRFAAWLQRQLVRRGWNSAELARRTDLAPATISRWVNGIRIPNKPEYIRSLADALDVHQDEVLEQLNMRDGGSDRMSLAVRHVAPTIDKYEWDDEELDQIVRLIESMAWMRNRA